MCAGMYNALLESWNGSYSWWCKHHDRDRESYRSPSRHDLFRLFTGVRADNPEWAGVAVQVGRDVICRYDRAVRSFYDRCARGGRAGYPRFKARSRWRSIEIPDPSPSMISAPGSSSNSSETWWRLEVKGVPRLRFRDNGRLGAALGCGATVQELRVVSTPLRVEVHVVVAHPHVVADDPPDGQPPDRPVGIDKGLAVRLKTPAPVP